MSNVGVADGMSVASPCTHDHTQSGEISRPVNGYDHYYNSSTGTKSCSVTVYYLYDEEWCISCGAVVSSKYKGSWEDHSNPNHD